MQADLMGTSTLPSSLWGSVEGWREVALPSWWTDVEGRPQPSKKGPPGALAQASLIPSGPNDPFGIVPFFRVVPVETGQNQTTLGDKEKINCPPMRRTIGGPASGLGRVPHTLCHECLEGGQSTHEEPRERSWGPLDAGRGVLTVEPRRALKHVWVWEKNGKVTGLTDSVSSMFSKNRK